MNGGTQHVIFATTRWSCVLAAAKGASDESLEWLCHEYWTPLYSYLRRFHGLGPTDAEDWTQEFFAYLLEHRVVARVKGVSRFRTFVKGVLKNFVRMRLRKDRRIKRGGGRKMVSLEAEGEDLVAAMAADTAPPEEILDRAWAAQALEAARLELVGVLGRDGREVDLDIFEAYTADVEGPRPTYNDLAERHGITEWDVWNRLSGAREELRSILRRRVAETVSHPAEVEEELEELIALMPGS